MTESPLAGRKRKTSDVKRESFYERRRLRSSASSSHSADSHGEQMDGKTAFKDIKENEITTSFSKQLN